MDLWWRPLFREIIDTLSATAGAAIHTHSSDGAVTYWSSHLDGAKSEKIVPPGHGANHNPQGIAEVARILKEHSGTKG